MNTPVNASPSALSAQALALPDAVALVSAAASLVGRYVGAPDVPPGAGYDWALAAAGLRENAFRAWASALAWTEAHPFGTVDFAETAAWADVESRAVGLWADVADVEDRALAQVAHDLLAAHLAADTLAPIRAALLARLPGGLRAEAQAPSGPSALVLDTLAGSFGSMDGLQVWVTQTLANEPEKPFAKEARPAAAIAGRRFLERTGVFHASGKGRCAAGLRDTLAAILRTV